MFLEHDIPKKMPFDADNTGDLTDALEQLLEGDFQMRWEATKRLAVLGKGTIAHIIPLLEDADLDWEVRWFAARVLSTFDAEPEALTALIQLLQHADEPELIAIAAEGLSQFGEQGVSALEQLLDSPAHRLTAIQALANVQHIDVLPPLFAVVADPEPVVRAAAIAAIANFRDPDADAVLIKAVKDPAAPVRKEAIAGLGRRAHLLATTDLVKIVQPGLWDLHPEVTQATAIAMGRLGTASAVACLVQVLQSPHTPETLQIQVVQALGWIEKAAALQGLTSMWQTALPALQVAIVEALSQWQSPPLRQQASAILLGWLQDLCAAPTDEKPTLKSAIAFALGHLKYAPAQDLLTTLAQDADAQTRLYAEAALRQLTS
jgi:HEAT repeat protein